MWKRASCYATTRPAVKLVLLQLGQLERGPPWRFYIGHRASRHGRRQGRDAECCRALVLVVLAFAAFPASYDTSASVGLREVRNTALRRVIGYVDPLTGVIRTGPRDACATCGAHTARRAAASSGFHLLPYGRSLRRRPWKPQRRS
eukprot:scaffold191378_cov28-Tisochrysis_lutea.AAC.1